MFLFKQILPAAIVALLVAAAVSALGLLSKNARLREALAPLALGGGYIAGHFYITGWVSFPPADTTNWLPYLALTAAVCAALFHSLARAPLRFLLFGLICLGALRLLLQPKFRYGWSAAEGWMWVACLALVIVALAIALGLLSRRALATGEWLAILLIVSVGSAGALMLSGSILLGQFATVLTAAVIGVLMCFFRGTTTGAEIAPVFSLLLGALLASGYFFAALPASSALLLAFAPGLALIPLRRPLGRVALVSLPTVAALFLAFRASPPLDY